jgi:formate dehydrogenase major subunit
MKVTRRKFLKVSGATAVGVAVSGSLFNLKPARAYAAKLKTRYAHESTTICPYCGVGCGLIVSTFSGKVINTEGNPEHPINEGSLCSKGNALFQVANNSNRMDKVLYRAPGADKWEEKSWDWSIKRMAQNIKKTRDQNFIGKTKGGNIVNRVEAIAGLGGAALDSEECYMWRKLATSLGIVYIEHQARI